MLTCWSAGFATVLSPLCSRTAKSATPGMLRRILGSLQLRLRPTAGPMAVHRSCQQSTHDRILGGRYCRKVAVAAAPAAAVACRTDCRATLATASGTAATAGRTQQLLYRQPTTLFALNDPE